MNPYGATMGPRAPGTLIFYKVRKDKKFDTRYGDYVGRYYVYVEDGTRFQVLKRLKGMWSYIEETFVTRHPTKYPSMQAAIRACFKDRYQQKREAIDRYVKLRVKVHRLDLDSRHD